MATKFSSYIISNYYNSMTKTYLDTPYNTLTSRMKTLYKI